MSIIGDVVLSASVKFLLNKLASTELLSFPREGQIQADLKKWESTLMKIDAVLEDAEEKQMTNQFVKKWLADLQNLAYDVEDILDEFATQTLERKLMHESEACSTSKVRKLIPTFVTNLNPVSLNFNVKMRSEMKKITKRLQEIAAQKNNFDLRENSEGRSYKVRYQRLPTTSLNETHVYGREKDQEAILDLLLKDEDDEDNEDGISVLPILGIGGVGKTTLAQMVYNDVRVKNHFDLRAWACVADYFDVVKVTKTILQLIIAPGSGDFNDLNRLQLELKEKLSSKKFLIVLDDIWNENYEKWTVLLRPFKANSSGSKIIITTRNESVSSMVGTIPTYPLKELSYDDCLSIFTYHSLGRKDFSGHQELQEIGEKIANRCKGLPLAAKTLGGLLRSKFNHDDWERVLNSKIWNLPEEKSDIIPALKLSYHYLPIHLKRCFTYCSLFPKDYEFQKEEIILLWMAEGFLQDESNEMQMEDLGSEYFRELESRSFFQQSSNCISSFVMHDLINDLAQWAVGEIFSFRMENTVECDKQNNISKNVRHLSYIGGQYDGIKKFGAFYGINSLRNLTYNGGLRDEVKMLEAFGDFKHLRTFLPLMVPHLSYLSHDILDNIPHIRRLRVLSLRGYEIKELSDAIGDLKHLRYLNLSRTSMHVLPESIGRLFNLQTLKLKYCRALGKLCTNIGNLINLRYLNIDSTHLEGMPLKIGKLTNLRMLSDFVVGKDIGSSLKELKFLKHLQGTLRISGLENVNDVLNAKEADLNGKRNLSVLSLEWGCCDSRNEKAETQLLDMLRPHQKLEQLTINGYDGMSFPAWLGDASFSNLVLLRFECCSNCVSLPSVGQLPSLKDLAIRRMASIKRVGLEFYGSGYSKPFPSLETLCFKHMQEWEDWIFVEAFPRLKQLLIVNCPKLRRLPVRLPSLKELVVRRCAQSLVSLEDLPASCEHVINGCKQVLRSMSNIGLGSDALDELKVSNCPTLVSSSKIALPSEVKSINITSCNELESLPDSWMDNKSLEYLCIGFCYSMAYLARNRLPPNVKRVSIQFCSKLLTLVQEEDNTLRSSTSDSAVCPSSTSSLINSELPATLEHIYIHECSNFVYLSSTGNLPNALKYISIGNCSKLESVAERFHDNASLQTFEISNCENLKLLPEHLHKLSHLERVSIRNCPSLVPFPERRLPSMNLTELEVESCQKLEALPNNMYQCSHLQRIKISNCCSIISFPERGLPSANLTEITIDYCGKLEALPNNMHQLNHLQKITISDCSSLAFFPEGGLPCTKLTQLIISNCEKLEALPNYMYNLTSLQQLSIRNCPSIKSFPEGGFPTNLTTLLLENLKIFKPIFMWGLHRLTSLEQLSLKDCQDLVSFRPKERGIMLPTSLTSLQIRHFPNLKCLSSVIQTLTSLEYLQLSDCSKLKSFSEKGLPLSLLKLWIYGCPLLNQRCKKEEGQCWPMIAFIPDVRVEERHEEGVEWRKDNFRFHTLIL